MNGQEIPQSQTTDKPTAPRRRDTEQNWASRRENLYSGVCEQQRRRPVCASAQSDQRLCYSLIGNGHIQTCYKQISTILASLCS